MDQSRTSRRPAGRSGFTLVELLVVIGIIAVLIGLLFPVIASVRKQARVAETRQQLSGIGMAINAYYADFNAYPGPILELLVQQVALNGVGNSPSLWAASLYVVNRKGVSTGVTSSENLFLGLEGGIEFTSAGSPPMINSATIKEPDGGPRGPITLNPAAPKR